jgi:hypothetical protein
MTATLAVAIPRTFHGINRYRPGSSVYRLDARQFVSTVVSLELMRQCREAFIRTYIMRENKQRIPYSLETAMYFYPTA